MLQPDAIEASYANFDQKRGVLVQCLRDHGVVVEDGETRDELVRATSDLLRKTGDQAEPANCFMEAGINSI